MKRGVCFFHAACPIYECISKLPKIHQRLLEKNIRIFRVGTCPKSEKFVCEQLFHQGAAVFISLAAYEKDPLGAEAVLKAILTKTLANTMAKGTFPPQLVVREQPTWIIKEDYANTRHYRDLEYEFLEQLKIKTPQV